MTGDGDDVAAGLLGGLWRGAGARDAGVGVCGVAEPEAATGTDQQPPEWTYLAGIELELGQGLKAA